MRMHILVREISVPLIHKQISEARARLKQPETIRRRRALRRVDKELEKGNYKSALSLVKQLQGKPGGLRGFGAAQQVPRRISSLDELKLGGEVEISSLELIVDSVLRSIKCSLEFALWEDDEEEVSLLGFRNLMNGEIKDSPCEDHLMCMQHEAGHFLVGYLLGVLPKRYKVPSVEDLKQDKFAQGNVEFLGFEFQRDVYIETMSKKIFTKGKLSNETLKKFLRVILGGLVAEHFMFGYSELLHSDVEKVILFFIMVQNLDTV
ncbi:Hypothetical predicted protein [Olea europaea subsp. europaea]|uniref:Uncharacterized protein n=1 Tax=Olea europaea subsp. europaea TaxID=158383 RepID=A0A8S0QW28_OLEEU|nr:Hypothetical predicted protein [Olea europaea subsp. europaea]